MQPLQWTFYTLLCFCLETELPHLLPCRRPLHTTPSAMPSKLVIPLVLTMMLLLLPPEEVVEEVRSVVVRPLV